MESATGGRQLPHTREFYVPAIVLDRASDMPLRRQIYRQIAGAIRDGAAGERAKLPSTRFMARLLRVSRNTVLAAYDELAADDLIRGERGAGMRVCGSGPAPAFPHLGRAIRAAHYPARVVALADQDENPLYINY
jgi:DNA-binding GntR family transcriptional regulator